MKEKDATGTLGQDSQAIRARLRGDVFTFGTPYKQPDNRKRKK